MSTIASQSPMNISETVRDGGLVPAENIIGGEAAENDSHRATPEQQRHLVLDCCVIG